MLAQPAAGLNTFFRGEVEENGLNSNDKLKKLAVDSNATCNKTLDSTEMEINSGNETFQDEASAGDINTQDTESSFEAIAETDQRTDEINDNPLVSPIESITEYNDASNVPRESGTDTQVFAVSR